MKGVAMKQIRKAVVEGRPAVGAFIAGEAAVEYRIFPDATARASVTIARSASPHLMAELSADGEHWPPTKWRVDHDLVRLHLRDAAADLLLLDAVIRNVDTVLALYDAKVKAELEAEDAEAQA